VADAKLPTDVDEGALQCRTARSSRIPESCLRNWTAHADADADADADDGTSTARSSSDEAELAELRRRARLEI
jgi:hypothetical protein